MKFCEPSSSAKSSVYFISVLHVIHLFFTLSQSINEIPYLSPAAQPCSRLLRLLLQAAKAKSSFMVLCPMPSASSENPLSN